MTLFMQPQTMDSIAAERVAIKMEKQMTAIVQDWMQNTSL